MSIDGMVVLDKVRNVQLEVIADTNLIERGRCSKHPSVLARENAEDHYVSTMD